MNSSGNPNELYMKASNGDETIDFWGKVPKSYHEAVDISLNNYQKDKFRAGEGSPEISKLKNILRDYHKELGIYSQKVEDHLELLDVGSVLVGQQPVLMGGPGFIANKLSCLLTLADIFQEKGKPLTPVFFVGDYDGLQKELARQYFPNPISQNAFIIDSENYLPEDSEIAAHAAEVPPHSWLKEYLEKLDKNLNGFKGQVKGDKKKLFDERWSHIKTLLSSTLQNSMTLSEWSTRIWGTITNIIDDFGVVFLPTSHPEIRELVAKEYLPFIEKAGTYVKHFQGAMDRIEAMGYTTTLPHRHEDYAPFTLECVEDSNRITTRIVSNDEGMKFAEGECPECKRFYNYRVDSEEDLQEIATLIGPRVDSSQAIFQDLMNIQIRISGPGEIAYYGQAAPAVKSIGYNLPVFVKYKRAFYNATWIEKLGKILNNRNQGALQQGDLFSILRKRTDGIKDDDVDLIQEAEGEMVVFIDQQYEKLLEANSSDADKYLGWQFGRFTPQKWGQEVSWIWFDMAIQTGLYDYISAYKRMYTKHSTLGGYFFINSQL